MENNVTVESTAMIAWKSSAEMIELILERNAMEDKIAVTARKSNAEMDG